MSTYLAAEQSSARQMLKCAGKNPISEGMQIFRSSDEQKQHMEGAGPGWYYDLEDQSVYRFWDGNGWTTHRSDVPVEPPVLT